MPSKIVAVGIVAVALRAGAAGWSKDTRDTFVGSCVAAATGNSSPEDKAKGYCECVVRDLEQKYTEKQFASATTKQTEQVKADTQAAIRACAKQLFAPKPGQVGWSDFFRGAFVGSCVDGATEKGAPKEKAEAYCGCVSKKLETTYTEDAFTKASFNPTDKYNQDVLGAAKGCVKHLQP